MQTTIATIYLFDNRVDIAPGQVHLKLAQSLTISCVVMNVDGDYDYES